MGINKISLSKQKCFAKIIKLLKKDFKYIQIK